MLEYITQHLLPRCNINPERNETYFKTELVFDSAMFLDVKKQYAYKLLIKEGNPLEKPKVKYTGIQVVKSDAAKITQQMLEEMIEKIALNSEIPRHQKIEVLGNTVSTFKNKFHEAVSTYNFEEIGLPGKWGGRDMFVNGMKLFNFIMNREIFSVAAAGRFVYCSFQNPPSLKGIDLKNTKGICVPYTYSIEEVAVKMQQFGIIVDVATQWDKLFTTTCHRVVQLIKNACR